MTPPTIPNHLRERMLKQKVKFEVEIYGSIDGSYGLLGRAPVEFPVARFVLWRLRKLLGLRWGRTLPNKATFHAAGPIGAVVSHWCLLIDDECAWSDSIWYTLNGGDLVVEWNGWVIGL